MQSSSPKGGEDYEPPEERSVSRVGMGEIRGLLAAELLAERVEGVVFPVAGLAHGSFR